MTSAFKFKIEQIALSVDGRRVQQAMALLHDLGMTDWTGDTVHAEGSVGRDLGQSNVGELAFNYQAGDISKPLELELLSYTEGDNFVARAKKLHDAWGLVTHIGMHVTAEQLLTVRDIMCRHSIPTSQEVQTKDHTNPAIKDSRRYSYTIFATRDLLGTDLKFIVRLPYPAPKA